MKAFLVLSGLVIALCFLGQPAAQAKPVAGLQKETILRDITNLSLAETTIAKDKADIQAAKKMLEEDMADQTKRSSLEDRLAKDRESLSAFEASRQVDVSSLRQNWRNLTAGQKNLVQQAEYDLE